MTMLKPVTYPNAKQRRILPSVRTIDRRFSELEPPDSIRSIVATAIGCGMIAAGVAALSGLCAVIPHAAARQPQTEVFASASHPTIASVRGCRHPGAGCDKRT